jgi:hypothetical protein
VDAIQPVSSSYSGAVYPAQSLSSDAVGATAAASEPLIQQVGLLSGQASSITAVSNSTSMVYSRVDNMLSNVGLNLQDNQMLRMIIALMILQAMLSQEGTDQQGGGVGLLSGVGGRSDSTSAFLAIQSQTNIVQVQHQSAAMLTSQAIQSLGLEGGQGQDNGARLDLSA